MCMISPVGQATSALLDGVWRLLPRSWRFHVSATSIFARRDGTRQWVVYSMKLRIGSEAAMILPVPIRTGLPDEAALGFLALDGAADLFERLDVLFREELAPARGGITFRVPVPRVRLPVRTVGSFEASFVPSVADFDRLDPRFQLPPAVWSKLPVYDDYGFAVFKLRAGSARVHPMAFWFETRDADRLFFPTVHVHDGEVHATAEFDHTLYWQRRPRHVVVEPISYEAPFVPTDILSLAPGVFARDELRRRFVRGTQPNEDQWQKDV